MQNFGLQKTASTPTRVGEQDNNQKRGYSLPAVPVLQNQPMQKMDAEEKEEEPLQRKFISQLKSLEEEGRPVKDKFMQSESVEVESPQTMQRFTPPQTLKPEAPQRVQRFIPQTSTVQKKENNTGLPDNLKEGVENVSGIAMNDVRVHYNSDKPAQLNALAYAQGTEIHVGSGQEKHLPHEAWHVVQQKQGRVKPTIQLKDKLSINDDDALEKEADVMGTKIISGASIASRLPSNADSKESAQLLGLSHLNGQDNQVRQFACGSTTPPALNDVIEKGTYSAPNDIANQIGAESENFSTLRGQADAEVEKTFGKGHKVGYHEKPKTGGGTGPAYYKDGETFYDKGAPMQQTVLNVIFETANAAQAGLFKKVENDFENGTLMDTPMDAYVDDPSKLGGLVNDYKDSASKRSLIQEYYEYNSFQIAKASMEDIAPKYTAGGDISAVTWETSFGAILECKDFEEYYNLMGNVHRGAVEATLRPKVESKESGGKINLDKLF